MPSMTTPSLTLLAQRINLGFRMIDDYRGEIGRMLIQVRQLLAPGESWSAWVADNIDRSMRDVHRCIKLASAPDPTAALEEARRADRDAKKERRAQEAETTRQTSVVPEPPRANRANRDVVDQLTG